MEFLTTWGSLQDGLIEIFERLKKMFCICHTNFAKTPNKWKTYWPTLHFFASLAFQRRRRKHTHKHVFTLATSIQKVYDSRAGIWWNLSQVIFFGWMMVLSLFVLTKNKRKGMQKRSVSGMCVEPQSSWQSKGTRGGGHGGGPLRFPWSWFEDAQNVWDSVVFFVSLLAGLFTRDRHLELALKRLQVAIIL